MTSPHDPINSTRWRSPQANFNIDCERHPRYNQNLLAEHPDLKEILAKLNGEKTEQTVDSLTELWEMERDQAVALAQRLVEIGFFELRGSKDAQTFWVPFLFRDALSMSQGLAE